MLWPKTIVFKLAASTSAVAISGGKPMQKQETSGTIPSEGAFQGLGDKTGKQSCN